MVGDLNKKGAERLTGNLLWIGWCGKTSGQGDIYAWGRRKTPLGEQRAQEDLRKEEQTLGMPGRELDLFEEQMGGQCCWSMASNVFFSENTFFLQIFILEDPFQTISCVFQSCMREQGFHRLCRCLWKSVHIWLLNLSSL